MSGFDTVVAGLLDAAAAALAATAAGPVARACDVPGDIAADGCDCGLLAVTVERIYPSATFPDPAGADVTPGCVPYLAADLTVTVLRCAPGPDMAGAGPGCVALDAAAAAWLLDAAAIRQALRCTLAALTATGVLAAWTIRAQTPNGPAGGCVGWDTRLTVAVPACLCPGGG